MRDMSFDQSVFNLKAALRKAYLLIERCECWRLPKYNPIDNLLPQLKDAVYEAESTVDELVYPGTNFVSSMMTDFSTTANMVLNRLNNNYNEMKDVCDSHGVPQNPNKFSQTARPITSTFLDTSIICGRDKELNEAIRLMGVPRSHRRKRSKNANLSNTGTSSSSTNKKYVASVLSIVGIGGVGKTTLAQMVCNHENVNSYFDLIMWVCVSDNFDMIKLTKEIIESATKKNCDINNLDTLQGILQGILNSKRFLLVLDDVWSKDWQLLLAPMKGASEGSVVMVTTRSHECVELVNTGMNSRGIIDLDGLEEKIYWDLFKRYAFDSVTHSNIVNPELEGIGKEICERLKGSPLAAKTIGLLLKTSMDVRHWKNIKNSEMWQIQQNEHGIIPVLQLSYQYLPSHLKRCFSYCSLYPKGFKFTKWELTNFWVMQGLISLPHFEVHWEEPFIEEAEGYFRELVQRSFFQKVTSSRSGEYIINDLMHDVCQSITKDECFCIADADVEKNISPDVRHLSLFRKGIKLNEQNELCKYEKLHSISVGPQSSSSCYKEAINNWCKKLTSIRSLSLSRCKFKSLPKSIRKLKHLKYLDISFTAIETFPESFCTLYNLLYLNMNGCTKIKVFPEEFNKLVNLRFLCIPVNRLILVGHIPDLAKKINRKDLVVHIGAYEKMKNLKFLNLSGTLRIYNLESVLSKQEAEEAHLNNKHLINRLCLYWSWRRTHTSNQSVRDAHLDEEVLEGLFPHINLKELEMDYYGGNNLSPSWLKEEILPNLTEVHINNCENVCTISHLPRWITILHIVNCQKLTNIQNCLNPNHLPMLKLIRLVSCEELVSLQVESFDKFLSLEEMNIVRCPKLTCPNAMVLPHSMKRLSLNSCGGLQNSIPSCLQDLTLLETLDIIKCPSLTAISFDASSNLQSQSYLVVEDCTELQSIDGLQFLPSLKVLYIRMCPRLVSIPTEAELASKFTSLSRIEIEDCAELQSVGGLFFLKSLKGIRIRSCPKLQETNGQDIDEILPPELLADVVGK